MSLGSAFRSIICPLAARRFPLFAGRLSDGVPFQSQVSGPQCLQPSFLFRSHLSLSLREFFSTRTGGAAFQCLTDNRFPKKRPGTKPRKKRASLKPPGPYAWVKYVPGEPIPRSRPNEGSVKGRKRIKRILQRKAFILSEKKKKQAEWKEAKRRKCIERTERKMAAVAREKAWAERLMQHQEIEGNNKAVMAS